MEGTPYPLSMSSAEAKAAIKTALDINKLSGLVLADGRGRARLAVEGEDYGFPLLTGHGEPTAKTVAELGQHYFNLAATKPPYEHVCVGYSGGGFVWQALGAGTGTLFTFRGFFLSLADLKAAISDAAPGDYAGVGSGAPYTYYAYDEAQSEPWVSIGRLEGAAGEGVPPHGSAGQVLAKSGAGNYETSWIWAAKAGYGEPLSTTPADFVGQIYADGSGGVYACTEQTADGTVWQRLAAPARVWQNLSIPAAAWTASSTLANYPYEARLELPRVTANTYLTVSFSEEDASGGLFAAEVRSYDGGLLLFAVTAPTEAVLIPTIKAEEVTIE